MEELLKKGQLVELRKFSTELMVSHNIEITFSDSDDSVRLKKGEDVLYLKIDDISSLYGSVVLFLDGGDETYKKAAEYLSKQFDLFLENNPEKEGDL